MCNNELSVGMHQKQLTTQQHHFIASYTHWESLTHIVLQWQRCIGTSPFHSVVLHVQPI